MSSSAWISSYINGPSSIGIRPSPLEQQPLQHSTWWDCQCKQLADPQACQLSAKYWVPTRVNILPDCFYSDCFYQFRLFHSDSNRINQRGHSIERSGRGIKSGPAAHSSTWCWSPVPPGLGLSHPLRPTQIYITRKAGVDLAHWGLWCSREGQYESSLLTSLTPSGPQLAHSKLQRLHQCCCTFWASPE